MLKSFTTYNKTKQKIPLFIWCLVIFLSTNLNLNAQFNLSLGNRSLENPFRYSNVHAEEVLQYERELGDKIKKYIDRDKFLVIVELEERMLPMNENKGRGIDIDTGVTVDRLPGLPNFALGSQATTVFIPQKPKYTYKHKINVLLDTSLSASSRDFVRRLLEGTGLINDKIGDELSVEFMAFPGNNDFWNQINPSTGSQAADQLLNDPNQQLLSKMEALLDKKMGNGDNSGLSDMPGPGDKDKSDATEEAGIDWLFWLILFLMIGVIALVVYSLFQNSKSSRTILEGVSEQNAQNMQNLQRSIEKLGQTLANPAAGVAAASIPKMAPTLGEPNSTEVKNDVKRILMEDLDAVVDHLNEVLRQGDETEIAQAAMAVSAANPSMLGYLRSLLEEEDFYRFEDAVTNSRYAAESEKQEALKNYRDNFVRHKTQNLRKLKMEKGKDIFQFLQQLNNNQIYQLIKDESEDMSAILLAQLPPQQTVELLRYFEIAKQTILLQRMSNISNVPTSMYKDVANKFSRKAIAVKDMGNVAVDGLASILNILDTLPLQQQDAYIEDIAKYDLDLARKIKEHFLTFDGLLEVESTKLLRAIEGVAGSDLAKALINAKPELTQLVLDSKTQRERDILESEIQLNSQISESEIEDARKQLMSVIKEKIKR